MGWEDNGSDGALVLTEGGSERPQAEQGNSWPVKAGGLVNLLYFI